MFGTGPSRATVAAAVAAAAVLSFGAATAASAAAPTATTPAGLSDCTINTVCLWTGLNFTGTLHEYTADQLHQGEWSVPGQRSKSAFNRTNGRFCTFNVDSTIQTNSLLGHTEGNLANLVTDWVGPCKH